MLKLRLEELRQDLFQRGYPAKVVNDAFARVRTIPREEALKKVEKKTNSREVLATSFHPGLPPLAKVLKRHHQVMLEEDATMKYVFQPPRLFAIGGTATSEICSSELKSLESANLGKSQLDSKSAITAEVPVLCVSTAKILKRTNATGQGNHGT